MNSLSRIAIASIVLLAGLLLALPFRKSPSATADLAEAGQLTVLAPVATDDVAAQLEPPDERIAAPALDRPAVLATLDPSEPSPLDVVPPSDPTETPAGFWTHHRSEPNTHSAVWHVDEPEADGTQTMAAAGSEPWFLAPPNPSTRPLPPRLSADYEGDLASGAGRHVPSGEEVRVHLVRDGDTLERLAKRYLGSEQRFGELYEFNRTQLSRPDLLPIGLELRIPPRDDYD